MTDQARLSLLSEWYQTAIGHSLYQFEMMQFAQVLPVCYGYQLLQIGGPADLSWLESSPIKHKIWLTPETKLSHHVNVFNAMPAELPFAANSLDVILLPHVLECVEQPEAVLSAAYEALTPGGYLVISGINCISLWGVQHKWQALQKREAIFPWLLHFQRVGRLQAQLLQLNCAIDALQIGHFLPVNAQSSWRLLETLGPIMWPALGANYMILARKQVSPMTPLKFEKKSIDLTSSKIGLAPQHRASYEKNS